MTQPTTPTAPEKKLPGEISNAMKNMRTRRKKLVDKREKIAADILKIDAVIAALEQMG